MRLAKRISNKGIALNLRTFLNLLRSRWITILVSGLVGLLGAIAVTLLTTPLYEASTRLFVSTGMSKSANEMYEGGLFSQQRVLSYTQLLTGESLAQRTIDKLGLDISATDLRREISATAKPDTVLIDVHVLDPSPVRARDIANTMSDEFVLKVRELETPEDGSKASARIVVEQRASVSEDPVVPRKKRDVALGLVLGLLFGVGYVMLRDRLDSTIKDREVLEEITGVGLVGAVPLDKERRKEPAIAFERDHSAISEAFRKLRTNLQFLSVDNPPRVITVTSSLPQEGKSTTAINLALVLAEAGNDVVVVDGDMRRPKIAEYLDVVGSVGFSTVLSNAVTLDDALQQTRYSRLTVLASGSIPPNPSELLGSIAAQRVLGELRSRFDYVIVDSSPLLAVTDAAVIANNSDGVLVIARYGQTKREQAAHAMKNLENVGATVLGSVFTMTPNRGGATYTYSYNYYGADTGSSRSRNLFARDAGKHEIERSSDRS